MNPLSRRRFLIAGMVGGLGYALPVWGQQKSSFGDLKALAESLPEDKDAIWTLSMNFKAPRIITADVPGRGKKVIWYMWYQVVNRTPEPRVFFPKFELVTIDRKSKHLDEILPSVQKGIAQTEDPTDRLAIRNSITISEEPIPVSKKDAFDTAITGVAIWSDIYDRAPDTNGFVIYVSGLSDGWVQEGKLLKRKTLQLEFNRVGDEKSTRIEFKRQKWVYRTSDTLDESETPAPKEEPKKE